MSARAGFVGLLLVCSAVPPDCLAQGAVFDQVPTWNGPAERTISMALGDVDGDGDLDLVRGNLLQEPTLYLNTGNTFASSPAWVGPREGGQTAVALGDVDGDGDLDIVRGNGQQGATLYLNTGGASDEASRGSRWVFDVALTGVQEPGQVTLTFEDLAGVPSDLEVRLVDRELEQTVDLRERDSYRYVARPNVRAAGVAEARFELVVGTAAYLDANSPTSAPRITRLLPNFPNPFAAGTIIRFELDRTGPVTVSVFDLSGRRVRTVADGVLEGGIHEVLWNGEDDLGLASSAGVYFVRMTTPSGRSNEESRPSLFPVGGGGAESGGGPGTRGHGLQHDALPNLT